MQGGITLPSTDFYVSRSASMQLKREGYRKVICTGARVIGWEVWCGELGSGRWGGGGGGGWGLGVLGNWGVLGGFGGLGGWG